MLNQMRQYLSALDINTEQKRYAMNFCKKVQYLEELHHIAIQDTEEHVCIGYGNVNSQICFVFSNKNIYDTFKSAITDILEKFNLSPWNIYITFINKTQKEYEKKYSFLVNELHAIGANSVFVFDKDETMYNKIIETFGMRNITLPERHFFIDIQKIVSTEDEDRKELWNSFKYLINYKEIEQED